MKLLVLAGFTALLWAAVNAAALTNRERSLIQSLADELRYEETGKETAEHVNKQGN